LYSCEVVWRVDVGEQALGPAELRQLVRRHRRHSQDGVKRTGLQSAGLNSGSHRVARRPGIDG
jgi:hypothetical protein